MVLTTSGSHSLSFWATFQPPLALNAAETVVFELERAEAASGGVAKKMFILAPPPEFESGAGVGLRLLRFLPGSGLPRYFPGAMAHWAAGRPGEPLN